MHSGATSASDAIGPRLADADRPSLLAILPCYNEAASIDALLQEIGRELPGADVIVVNDGSADATSGIARQRTRVLDLPINLGIGGAVQTGIIYAHRNGYAMCVQIDGDGQHPPAEVHRLIR